MARLLADRPQLTPALPHSGHRLPQFFVRDVQVALTARAWRPQFSARFTAVLESVDAMACPAGGAPAWPVTRAQLLGGDLVQAMSKALPRSSEFTMPMNLAGTPAICLPSGFSAEGLPYSIQFAGRRLSEPTLCRLAYAYEQATKWHTRHPTL